MYPPLYAQGTPVTSTVITLLRRSKALQISFIIHISLPGYTYSIKKMGEVYVLQRTFWHTTNQQKVDLVKNIYLLSAALIYTYILL